MSRTPPPSDAEWSSWLLPPEVFGVPTLLHFSFFPPFLLRPPPSLNCLIWRGLLTGAKELALTAGQNH